MSMTLRHLQTETMVPALTVEENKPVFPDPKAGTALFKGKLAKPNANWLNKAGSAGESPACIPKRVLQSGSNAHPIGPEHIFFQDITPKPNANWLETCQTLT